MTDRPNPDDLEVMAASLALGLLDPKERAEALRRQLGDPNFAERVRAWQGATDRWLEEVEPVEAPPNVLSSIEDRLDRRTPEDRPHSAVNDKPASPVWRSWAITATAASLALAVGLGVAVRNPTQGPAVVGPIASASPNLAANVAQIKDDQGSPLLSALYNPNSGTLSLRLADLQQPDFGPELWIIPKDGVPRSLGLLDSERLTVTLSPELRTYLKEGATMAITIEPREGAPHDAPTGEILGTATLQEVPASTI